MSIRILHLTEQSGSFKGLICGC